MMSFTYGYLGMHSYLVYVYNSFLSTAELNPLCEYPTICLSVHYWKILELFPALDIQLSWVQSLSHVRLFATLWTAACQASLSITNSRSLLRFMCIEFMMPSNHLILYQPLLLPPSTFPSIRVFSNESVLLIRWPKYWSFNSASASVLPMNTIQDWSLLGWTGWMSLQSKGLSRVFSNTTVKKHQFFSSQLSSQSNSHIHTWPQEKP